jgi:redox-sensing transcriptional repressor
MPGRTRVPRPTVDRLSLYLRELERLETQDRGTVSSRHLGTAAGASEAQVRKDLGIIGHTGQSGIGYSVPLLAEAIRQVIGVHRQWRAALVGAGNVGRALAAYRRFREEGFEIVAIFDEDAAVVGRTVAGMEVLPMTELAGTVKRESVGIGIITVPPDSAQQVADALVDAGVQGILTFAPRRLRVAERVPTVDVDFRSALERLVLEISERQAPPARR